MQIIFLSPAKINLFFRVLKKRPDGFHEVETLYQAIDLYDEITFTQSEKDEIICTHPHIPKDNSNLILRAKDLFTKKTGIKQSFKIDLKKKIPMESGLGGGSSNAATTLWALNALLKTNIEEAELATWGGELGSDVSFFFTNGRALGRGRGEILEKLKPEDGSVWIAKPNIGLSTAAVYQVLKPKPYTPHFENDLEIPAFELIPKLKEIKRELLELGFEKVQLTGSGSAFYCIGKVQNPKLNNIEFYPVQFSSRIFPGWYAG